SIFVMTGFPSVAQNFWAGTWETHWATGSARMILSQDGARVTGSYPLLSGQIEAAAEGKLLRGRWSEDKREGSFEFILAEDGQSFIGRRDGVEWWTGARSQRPQAQMQGSADTPRSTLRSFLNAGNLGRDSDKDQWALAASLLVTDANDPVTSPEDKLARTIEYFRLLDLLTIRFPDLDLFGQTDAREVVVPLPIADSLENLSVVFLRHVAGGWRIKLPSRQAIARDRDAILALLGQDSPAQRQSFEALGSPRDTIRSFLIGVSSWDQAGQDLALSTLDLSKFQPVTREAHGELAALQLRRVLERIGIEALQAIPNRLVGSNVFEIFTHSAGNVVLVADGAADQRKWRFSSETVERSMELLRASDKLPATQFRLPGAIPTTAFFSLRDAVSVKAPFLLKRAGRMEIWQVLGSLTGLSLSVLLGMISARLLIILLRRPVEREFLTPKWFRPSLVFCVTLLFGSPVPIIFGVPPHIRHVTVPIIGIALVLLMTMIMWQLLKIYSLHFSRIAERSLGAGDDIAVSLLFALLRLSTIAACGLGLAHFLSISPVNILAGLGIGGLAVAFAARETIANIFGAAVLAVDRPFKRGDMISMGDVRGTVEHVGIRSTRLRTIKNSEIVVPNAKLADTSITNHGASDPQAQHAIFRLSLDSDTVSLSDFVDELKVNFGKLSGISGAENNILIHRIDGKDVEIKILLPAPSDSNENRKLLEDLALGALAKGREVGIGLAWTPA
ncbi:MAG: hypothetical protein EBT34_05760, partial [Acetobacteraceae bacterium]|nr:hypothetical protein [Acetobacteraceae bacterium]